MSGSEDRDIRRWGRGYHLFLSGRRRNTIECERHRGDNEERSRNWHAPDVLNAPACGFSEKELDQMQKDKDEEKKNEGGPLSNNVLKAMRNRDQGVQ